MRGDVQVDDAPSVVRQHHEPKQPAKRGGGDREEVDRGELGDVIGEAGAPGLGRGTVAPPEILRHRRLRDGEAELQQLTVDPGHAPERVRCVQVSDQLPDRDRHGRSAHPSWP